MKKFWNWIRNDDGERILRLEGPIDEDDFWGDGVTPKAFRDELEAEEGDVTVWINSPGGNVFCSAEIYTMLCDHKGKVTVKIDAIAASAASVIAMAGDRVLMSPVAMLMVHNPMTIAMGNTKDMEKAISTLNEVKESIINAYQRKTGLSRNKISQLMENETWMNARKAVDLGFADEILFAGKPAGTGEEKDDDEEETEAGASIKNWQPYSTRIMGQTILGRLGCAAGPSAGAEEAAVDAADKTEDLEPAEEGVGQPTPEVDQIPGEDTLPTEEPLEESVEESVEEPADITPKKPGIGMDGRTEDGSMPFELLMKQLEFLR